MFTHILRLSTLFSGHLQDINLTKTVFILLIVSGYCAATIDLSNLNVNDFQFFRYQQRLPNGELKAVSPPPSSIESHFQRAKAGILPFNFAYWQKTPLKPRIAVFHEFYYYFAVGTFFQRLLFGYTGDDAKPIPMVFPPTVDHLREQFKQKYGYRGEYLVEQLGNGHFRYSSGYMPCLSCKH